jgi:hypothetical protein
VIDFVVVVVVAAAAATATAAAAAAADNEDDDDVEADVAVRLPRTCGADVFAFTQSDSDTESTILMRVIDQPPNEAEFLVSATGMGGGSKSSTS